MPNLKEHRLLDNPTEGVDLPLKDVFAANQFHDTTSVQQPLQPLQKRQFIRPVPQVTPLQVTPRLSLPATHPPRTPSAARAVLQVPLPAQQRTVISPIPHKVTEQLLSTQQPILPLAVPQPRPPLPSPQPLPQPKKQRKQQAKMTRGKRMRRVFVICSLLTIIAVVFMSQANGASGAWTADVLRAVVGPTLTAQFETWFLGLADTTHQVQYHLNGQRVEAPWTVGATTAMPTVTLAPKTVALAPMPLDRISPMVTPAIGGEGVWLPQGTASSPYT